MTSTDCVTVTTRVAVDPATAFAVFTEEIDAWWGRGPRFRFRPSRDGIMMMEPGVEGRLLEVYDESGEDVFEVGRVRVWEPPARLVFDFRARNFEPGQKTEVEVRFTGEEGGTRVTVEHRGWDRLPPDHPARHGLAGGSFTNLIGTWWAELLTRMRRTTRG